MAEFTFLVSKITADGDCCHGRHLLLGRKVMTNLDSILKGRDITLSTKVHLVKAMVFSVVMLRVIISVISNLCIENENHLSKPIYFATFLFVCFRRLSVLSTISGASWVFSGTFDVYRNAHSHKIV